MSTDKVEKAVQDARDAELSCKVDRVLSEALVAFLQVSGRGANGAVEPTPAQHVAACLAMLVPVCEHLAPGTVPDDFPLTELFAGLAADPAFGPVADAVLEEVAFEFASAVTREGDYQAGGTEEGGEGVPDTPETVHRGRCKQGDRGEEPCPEDALDIAAIVTAHTAAPPGGPELAMGAAELGRMFLSVSRALGVPVTAVEPYLVLIITIKDVVTVYKNRRSIAAAWKVFTKDWRMPARLMLLLVQYVTATVLASNESPFSFAYWTRPFEQVLMRTFRFDQDWRYTHPSSTNIMNVIGSLSNVPIFWGLSNTPENEYVPRIVARLRWILAGYDDTKIQGTLLTSFYTKQKWMPELQAWIEVVQANKSFYAGVENFSIVLAVAMQLLNSAAMRSAFDVLVTRFSGPPREQILTMSDEIKRLGRKMDINDMDEDVQLEQIELDSYADRILAASARNKIETIRLVPLMNDLLYVRRRTKENYGIEAAELEDMVTKVIRDFEELQLNYGDPRIDARVGSAARGRTGRRSAPRCVASIMGARLSRLHLGETAAEAQSSNGPVTIRVSGGNFVSPYYAYRPSLPPAFEAGTTYVFVADGIRSAHPFRVGTARGTTPEWVTGSTTGIAGAEGAITMAVPADYTGEVVLYCEAHASMTLTKAVTANGAARPTTTKVARAYDGAGYYDYYADRPGYNDDYEEWYCDFGENWHRCGAPVGTVFDRAVAARGRAAGNA